MNFLTSKIRPMYFKYLVAAFGSALISSIYGVIDMAMVGQYQGADGNAALAVINPVWNIIYSLGLLMGIGGSVVFSNLRGKSEENHFILLPLNIFSTYYFQALMKPATSFIVSVSRGALISGIFIYLLPAIAGADAIQFSMPLTELIVAIYVIAMIIKYTKQLPKERTVL